MNIHEQLIEPFHPLDIEWRVQQCGISKNGSPWAMVLAYVTNRAIQNRLDDVFGVMGWENHFKDIQGGGVECGISARIGDGEWVTKWDAADNTDIEAIKGGRSGAMKRAAVQWGIGRYLYKLDVTFATCSDNPKALKHRAKDAKTGKMFSWDEPQLPAWAMPSQKPKIIDADQLEILNCVIEESLSDVPNSIRAICRADYLDSCQRYGDKIGYPFSRIEKMTLPVFSTVSKPEKVAEKMKVFIATRTYELDQKQNGVGNG